MWLQIRRRLVGKNYIFNYLHFTVYKNRHDDFDFSRWDVVLNPASRRKTITVIKGA